MKATNSSLILILLVIMFALISWNSCTSQDTEQILGTATQDWTEEPRQIVKDYYDALNAKDWDRALSFLEKPNPLLVKTWQALDPTYEILEIQRFSNFSATMEAEHPVWRGYEGDVEGKCISLYIKEDVFYPSGWGERPSGTYSRAFVLVENEGSWKISDWGFIGSDACKVRIKTLEAPH
ncbi:MAG: DUF4829 domain-containing protein [Anaerolineaceae bacterium]